jgi:hypothetical protein
MGGLKRFVFFLVGFTFLSVIATALFEQLVPEYLVSRVLKLIPVFYFVLLLISKIILFRITSGNDRKFTQTFLGITIFRFLLYLAVLITYSLLFPADAVRFIISFFIFYFLYTVLEISYLYRDLHPRKN